MAELLGIGVAAIDSGSTGPFALLPYRNAGHADARQVAWPTAFEAIAIALATALASILGLSTSLVGVALGREMASCWPPNAPRVGGGGATKASILPQSFSRTATTPWSTALGVDARFPISIGNCWLDPVGAVDVCLMTNVSIHSRLFL